MNADKQGQQCLAESAEAMFELLKEIEHTPDEHCVYYCLFYGSSWDDDHKASCKLAAIINHVEGK